MASYTGAPKRRPLTASLKKPPAAAEAAEKERRRVLLSGGEELVYSFQCKRVKNLNLRVRPDGSVAVSAPPRCPASRADDFVRAKGAFILRAKEQFRQTTPPRDGYASGGELTLLGERVSVQTSRGPFSAERRGSALLLTLPEPEDQAAAERLLGSYLDKLCRERFTPIMAGQYTLLRRDFAVDMPRLRIREMKTRWGSCIPQKGVVTLNRRLICQPLSCVEYVILHELCHLVVPNHSPDFYALVARWMPDWRERRAVLNGRKAPA